MSDAVQIVISAQDKASAPIKNVENHLLKLSKNARLLHRETYGLRAFAGALDTIAGTHLSSLISDLSTVGEVADPLAKSLGSTSVVKKVEAAGANLGTKLMNAVGPAAVLVAPAAVLTFLPALIGAIGDHLTGRDLTSQLASVGKQAAENTLSGYSDTVKSDFANVVQTSFDQALAGGATYQAAADAGKAAGDAFLTNLKTAVDPMATLAAHALSEHADDLKAAATNVGSDMGKALAAKEIWDKSAQAITSDLATGIQNTTGVISTAMDKVAWAIKHPEELIAQEANIEGAIATLEYSKGLHSNEPEVVAVINQQEAALKLQWQQIAGVAYDSGVHAGFAFYNGYRYALGHNKVNIPGYANPDPLPPKGGFPHRAAGGAALAGHSYVVNERGTETLHMGNQSGYISPAGNSAPPIQIFLDGRKIFDVVNERLGKRLALTGGNTYTRG